MQGVPLAGSLDLQHSIQKDFNPRGITRAFTLGDVKVMLDFLEAEASCGILDMCAMRNEYIWEAGDTVAKLMRDVSRHCCPPAAAAAARPLPAEPVARAPLPLQCDEGYLQFNPIFKNSSPEFEPNQIVQELARLPEVTAHDASSRRGAEMLVFVCTNVQSAPGTKLHVDWMRAWNLAMALTEDGSADVRRSPRLLPLPAAAGP